MIAYCVLNVRDYICPYKCNKGSRLKTNTLVKRFMDGTMSDEQSALC